MISMHEINNIQEVTSTFENEFKMLERHLWWETQCLRSDASFRVLTADHIFFVFAMATMDFVINEPSWLHCNCTLPRIIFSCWWVYNTTLALPLPDWFCHREDLCEDLCEGSEQRTSCMTALRIISARFSVHSVEQLLTSCRSSLARTPSFKLM